MFTRSSRTFIDNKPKFKTVRLSSRDPVCRCGNRYPRRRKTELGLNHCLSCSPEIKKTANVPMHKQAYGYSSDPKANCENAYSSHK